MRVLSYSSECEGFKLGWIPDWDCSTSDQWYNIILRDNEKRQQKVEALRKERQKIEMKECTFAPEFLTKPSRRLRKVTSHLHFDS